MSLASHGCVWSRTEAGHQHIQRNKGPVTGSHKQKPLPTTPRLSRGKTQIHAQAVGQRWQLFITIDVRIHNKTRRLSLLRSVLLKGELLSSPPSCCSLSSLGSGETVMINALSAGISDEEPGVPAQVLFAHWWFTHTIFTEWSKSGK